MAIEGYAEAIRLDRIERELAKCVALDAAYPPDDGDCARRTVLDSVCPCMLCEDAICNVLAANVHQQLGHQQVDNGRPNRS